MKSGPGNQKAGKGWEDIFETRARYNGLLPIRNLLSVRMIRGGKMLPVKSNLDWCLVQKPGKCAYVDTKTFNKSFKYSMIDEAQLERALLYNLWGIPSGFVVWFRTANRVVYFSANQIFQVGPGNSFGPEHGMSLGDIMAFDLRRIFVPPAALSGHSAAPQYSL